MLHTPVKSTDKHMINPWFAEALTYISINVSSTLATTVAELLMTEGCTMNNPDFDQWLHDEQREAWAYSMALANEMVQANKMVLTAHKYNYEHFILLELFRAGVRFYLLSGVAVNKEVEFNCYKVVDKAFEIVDTYLCANWIETSVRPE